jgi:hypothetical protein
MRELSGRELDESMRADEARRWRERAANKAASKRAMDQADAKERKTMDQQKRLDDLMCRYLEQELRAPRQVQKAEGPAGEPTKPSYRAPREDTVYVTSANRALTLQGRGCHLLYTRPEGDHTAYVFDAADFEAHASPTKSEYDEWRAALGLSPE